MCTFSNNSMNTREVVETETLFLLYVTVFVRVKTSRPVLGRWRESEWLSMESRPKMYERGIWKPYWDCSSPYRSTSNSRNNNTYNWPPNGTSCSVYQPRLKTCSTPGMFFIYIIYICVCVWEDARFSYLQGKETHWVVYCLLYCSEMSFFYKIL